MSQPKKPDFFAIVLVAIAYGTLAYICLRLSVSFGSVSPFWLPSGFATAMVYLGGPRYVISVWLGIFFSNVASDISPAIAAIFGLGNVCEALISGALLRKVQRFNPALENLFDVLFLGFVSVFAPLVSAFVGVTVLQITSTLVTEYSSAFFIWWAGNAVGILTSASLILVFRYSQPLVFDWKRVPLGIILAGSAVVLALVAQTHNLPFVLFPVLILTALRFGQKGTVIIAILITMVLVSQSAVDLPLSQFSPALAMHLARLQLTIGLLFFSGMLLAAAIHTEEKGLRYAEALERERRTLQEVERVKVELEKAKDKAESANRAKSAFLANISHEIRTPLGIILGLSDLLSEPSIDEVEKQHFVDTIRRNGLQLQELIDEVLDLSKVEAGRLTIKKTEFPLASLLRDIQTSFEIKAAEKGLDFTIEAHSAIPTIVHSDEQRLRQILFNIIGNAIKFSDKGSIVLEVVREEDNFLVFRVRDTGVGISEEKQALLFRPFSQLDSSPSRRFGGTGLGLFLSRQLAHLLGGDVYLLESSEGEGSVFIVRIPIKS